MAAMQFQATANNAQICLVDIGMLDHAVREIRKINMKRVISPSTLINHGAGFVFFIGLFEHVWDPLSQKQTVLAIKLIRGMAEVYPNFHAQDKSTQVRFDLM